MRKIRNNIKTMVLLLSLSFLTAIPTTNALAQNNINSKSSGELGMYYAIEFSKPIVIGSLMQVNRGILPSSPIVQTHLRPEFKFDTAEADEGTQENNLSAEQLAAALKNETEESLIINSLPSEFAELGGESFNPDLDFDEMLFVNEDFESLYVQLHKRGGRITNYIYPLAKVPAKNLNIKNKRR